jgi:uncharacterized protein (TIGR00106 family)
MKALADICVIPIGVGVSVSEYVVACEEIFNAAGLNTQLHSYGTNVEGEWDDVMAALKKCHERVHQMGAPRVSTTIRLGTRTDRVQSMQDKIDSVTSKMAGD